MERWKKMVAGGVGAFLLVVVIIALAVTLSAR